MKQVISVLTEKMKTYTPGDLIAEVEIKDLFQSLCAEALEEEDEAYFQGLSKKFSEIARSQDQAGYEELSAIIKGLEKGCLSKKDKHPEKAIALVDDLEVLNSFVSEASDHLESLEDKILSLENNGDKELINSIFRSMHTIKGVASFIGLSGIKTITHSLESLLDNIREGKIKPAQDIIDLLLEGSDAVRRAVAYIEKQLPHIKPGMPVSKLEKGDALEELSLKIEMQTKASEIVAELPEDFPEDLITPDMIEKFVAESNDLLDSAEQNIIRMEKEPEYQPFIDEAFRSIHTVKGNAGFFWFKKIEASCMKIESVLDVIRKKTSKINHGMITSLLDDLDYIRKALSRIASGGVREEQKGVLPDKGGVSVGETREPAAVEPLGEVLLRMGAVSKESIEKALDKQQMKLGELLLEDGALSEEELSDALQKQGKSSGEGQDQFSSYTVKRKDIRVDTVRLDKLFDLMGELITAEAMLIGNPELEKYDIPGFEKAAAYLSKITREMQEITMSVRMIPLEGLFSKMRRLVRDLSRKFDKRVNLVVTGEETEMDRNVIEEISDPLVHIIRNSIDHGIEDKKTRKSRGKDETGLISLDARYEGNEIWITVNDDGGGLSRDKILRTARERGILKEESQDLSDSEIWQLIFEPGFSTAEKVSEISGRGGGMDVVKKNLEKLRGKIDVSSVIEKGTKIILKIPLTLAIIDAVTVRVGKMLYSIPISDILEFHKAKTSEITCTDSYTEVLNLRKELIPIIKLFTYFRIEQDRTEKDAGIHIIVHNLERKAAVLVDEILGYRQIVIKALPEYLSSMKSTSGCTVLGDGRVSLILDVGSLLQEMLE